MTTPSKPASGEELTPMTPIGFIVAFILALVIVGGPVALILGGAYAARETYESNQTDDKTLTFCHPEEPTDYQRRVYTTGEILEFTKYRGGESTILWDKSNGEAPFKKDWKKAIDELVPGKQYLFTFRKNELSPHTHDLVGIKVVPQDNPPPVPCPPDRL